MCFHGLLHVHVDWLLATCASHSHWVWLAIDTTPTWAGARDSESDEEMHQDHLNNRRGVFGYTLLHEAVSGNKPDAIPSLVTNDNINARANLAGYRYTPLHLAASAGHIECVKVLLNYGADISLADIFGRKPKDLSSKTTITQILRSEGKL